MPAALETRLPTPRPAPPLTAPPTPVSGSPTGRRPRLALALLVSAQFVVMLDTSIVNVALPAMQSGLGLTPTGTTWVVNAYVLAVGGLLLLSGRAADLIGRRRMFVAGSALFTMGTLVAATATGQGVLVGGRILQGVGAAALSPAAMSLLLLTFPGAARARAMGLWGAASTLGGATGVMAGGLLVGSFGWSSVFVVTVPVSVAGVVLARRLLPDDVRGARRPFDWFGSAAVTGAAVALVHAALGLADHGLMSVPVFGGLVASMVLLWAFGMIERRAADPLVPLELLRSRPLDAGVVLAVLGGAARASTFVLVALYLQQMLAMAPQQAGFAMVPTALTGFVVSLALLPRMVRALGAQRTLVVGMVVLAAGHLWLASAPLGAGYLAGVLPGLLLVATGVALSFTPTTMVIASAVPATHTGLAAGLAGSATQIGAAVGIASFTAIGLAVAEDGAATMSAAGFAAAFTTAAAVSLATALMGVVLVAAQRSRSPITSATGPASTSVRAGRDS
ncbi:MFS transporter [Humibacillus xanthopallidus]|uniref:MFS transporter n=1 Tax=Humibacillus xanthopallidus TaxID=412689 RepID=A0A543PR51_9MICO|nr:MFS transporter [Humibacillus xanthopallidus]TQN46550.1 MFS transporter [Humibacillus xanthopallidus]